MKIEIDLVYLWVDGNDPEWQAKRAAFIGNVEENSSINCKGRYVDNDELKYSLRSVDKYATWIRNIFIVTDNQTPAWLDTSNPKIKIIDHKEILPPESLPCFNSSLLEKFLHKIPGLSEHFLFANDDMFLNKTVTPDTFFAPDGLPIFRLSRKRFSKIRRFWRKHVRRKPLLNYSQKISNAAGLVKKKYGVFYTAMPHHNIDAYRKSDCKKVIEEIFNEKLRTEFGNRMRNSDDTHRTVYAYVALAEKRGHLRYSSPQESLHLSIHKESHYQKLKKYQPIFFCMNDSQYAQDSDRIKAKAFLEEYFPDKSSFEK